ncbi:MAG: SIS domain-containing protein [Actinobacteria bacterium]|nr:SIS domain-containing protein [Actinomycetota bacterium]
MCGIVALVGRPSARPVPDADEVMGMLDAAVDVRHDLDEATRRLVEVDRLLHGVPGIRALVDQRQLMTTIEDRLDRFDDVLTEWESRLDDGRVDDLETDARRIGALRDVLWAIRRDRLRTATEVAALAGRDASVAAIAGYAMVQQALSIIDRLEVRGRDSAGVHLFVWGHDLRADDQFVVNALSERADDALFQNRSVRWVDTDRGGVLSFVYKAAAEIGELGDNTRALRRAIADDDLLRLALSRPEARMSLTGHTRWASVGIISEPNAHPVNSERLEPSTGPYVVASLNGDVDNHADLRVAYDLEFAHQITTDAKVIPALVAHHMESTSDLVESFRRSVSSFEGSVAIAAASADDPHRLLVSLRGSGQGLFVGFSEDLFVVASEPYGVVEETSRYVRMDGEVSVDGGAGQIVVLDGELAGTVDGFRRISFGGTELPWNDDDLVTAEVTTRDIDRGDAPHFLLKEIGEAPISLAKTLRGRIRDVDGRLRTDLGERVIPGDVAARLTAGTIDKVRVIGQGTAAVAGESCATILDHLTDGRLDVDPVTATELSGFGLRLDMSDTLIVAISQSGTTTDTNRTVDLARARGAAVIAIVNRRGSDLCDKADGVLYTSDGRDVEMSVASTKAFYAQVAAGTLLACEISALVEAGSDDRRHQLLSALRDLPDAMRQVLTRREQVGDIARRYAPSKRYWAVVGNGPNAIAAHEVRIKLSELCYKSISSDITEDKKHIDLSCEPLILVCAAGLAGGTADDVAKEVAIYRAHKATPIVIASARESRFSHASSVIEVPETDPSLAFVLSAMVGHLFGYEAARAIDDLARDLREAREVVERAVIELDDGEAVVERIGVELADAIERFQETLRSGDYDGHLEASTAVRLATMFRVISDDSPVEMHQRETGKVASPAAVVDDLTAALTRAIEELTRPIDAIKHQAKTVTVGISRSDEGVLDRSLVQAVLGAGPGRDVLAYRTLKVLADLDPAVESVVGYTRYRIDGDLDHATVTIVERGGISRDIPSRVDTNPALVGTKRRVASEREVLVARGRSDGRTVIFVPEVKAGSTVGLVVLHVRFHDRLPASVARAVLQGYDRRYERLVDWVTETEGAMRDDVLETVSVADLLIRPMSEIADLWRR